jgi:hypothetical protein
MRHSTRLLAAVCAFAALAIAAPTGARAEVKEEWIVKGTTKFLYDTASADLYTDTAKLSKHAADMLQFYNDQASTTIGFWFDGYTDARCDPNAKWVKDLKLRNPCKLNDSGVTPANNTLSIERAATLKVAVFSKLSATNQEKLEEYVAISGFGEQFADVSKAACYADSTSCASDRYSDATFVQKKVTYTPPPPVVSLVPDAVTFVQGPTSVNIPVRSNDTCERTTCSSVLTTYSSSTYMYPYAIRDDGSFDVWVHPYFEGTSTFLYSLVYTDLRFGNTVFSDPAEVRVTVTPQPPPPPPPATPRLTSPPLRWARLNADETLTAKASLACDPGQAVSSTRCAVTAGNRRSAVVLVSTDVAVALTPPAGYPSNRFTRVSNTQTGATYRFSQATPAGKLFSVSITGTVTLRHTEERLNPDGTTTILSSSDVQRPVSTSSRLGVVGATR